MSDGDIQHELGELTAATGALKNEVAHLRTALRRHTDDTRKGRATLFVRMNEIRADVDARLGEIDTRLGKIERWKSRVHGIYLGLYLGVSGLFAAAVAGATYLLKRGEGR